MASFTNACTCMYKHIGQYRDPYNGAESFAHKELSTCSRFGVDCCSTDGGLHIVSVSCPNNVLQWTPSTADTHDIADKSESPDRFSIDFNPFPTIPDHTRE